MTKSLKSCQRNLPISLLIVNIHSVSLIGPGPAPGASGLPHCPIWVPNFSLWAAQLSLTATQAVRPMVHRNGRLVCHQPRGGGQWLAKPWPPPGDWWPRGLGTQQSGVLTGRVRTSDTGPLTGNYEPSRWSEGPFFELVPTPKGLFRR